MTLIEPPPKLSGGSYNLIGSAWLVSLWPAQISGVLIAAILERVFSTDCADDPLEVLAKVLLRQMCRLS